MLAGVPVPGSRDGQVRGQPLVVFGYSQAGIADLEQRNLPTAPETSPNISVGHELTRALKCSIDAPIRHCGSLNMSANANQPVEPLVTGHRQSKSITPGTW